MYPVIRVAKEWAKFRNAPTLQFFETYVGEHRCWPQDIDLWMELNNGRTLTLYDLGRIVLFQRLGLFDLMKRNGWVGTIAGASIRYRRRVQLFHRLESRSRIVGWDARFLYVEQSLWRNGDCASHGLLRTGVTDRKRLVPMSEVEKVPGIPESPPLPQWVTAWSKAENRRPWPPMQE